MANADENVASKDLYKTLEDNLGKADESLVGLKREVQGLFLKEIGTYKAKFDEDTEKDDGFIGRDYFNALLKKTLDKYIDGLIDSNLSGDARRMISKYMGNAMKLEQKIMIKEEEIGAMDGFMKLTSLSGMVQHLVGASRYEEKFVDGVEDKEMPKYIEVIKQEYEAKAKAKGIEESEIKSNLEEAKTAEGISDLFYELKLPLRKE